MNKFIDFISNSFAPKINKITRNPWIQGVQSAVLLVLPMVFVGSIVTILDIIKEYVPFIPNLSVINQFSFGLLAVFIAFLIPYQIMEKKKNAKMKILAGMTSLALFFITIRPEIVFNPETYASSITFDFARFGSQGMFAAIITGIFVSIVMNSFSKFSFFKETSALPDFVINWFDSILPVTICLLTGWLLIYQLNFDVFQFLINIFQPLASSAQTLPGFVFFCFISVFFYSFGISSWILSPITYPIMLTAIAANAQAVAGGGVATWINTNEVVYSGWITIGGIGATLPLVILMFMSKAKRLKAIGRATIIPSIININEPVVFGAPIVWNPLLMIPFWLNGLILPLITYIALSSGLATIPSRLFSFWYMPFGISTWMLTGDWRGLVLLAVNFAVSFLIWIPFYKAYEKQVLIEEATEE